MLILVLLVVCLLTTTAMLTLLESMLIYVDEIRLAYILSHRPPRPALLQKIIQQKQAYLSSIVLLINLISIGGSAMTGGLAAQLLDDWYLAVFSTGLTYIMLVFAKMLPKLLGPQVASQWLPKVSLIVHVLYLLATPLRWITLIWVRIFKIQSQNTLCLDELKFMLRHFNHEGLIHKETRKALEQVLASEHKTIESLAKPAPSLTLQASHSITQAKEVISTSHQKRYLVSDQEEFVGIVLRNNINKALLTQCPDYPLSSIMKPVSHLKPSTSLIEALQILSTNKHAYGLVFKGQKACIFSTKAIYRAILKKSKKQKANQKNLKGSP